MSEKGWRPLSLWRATVALSRGAIQWWHCPRTDKPVIRTRAGAIYDLTYMPSFGWMIRPRREELFD